MSGWETYLLSEVCEIRPPKGESKNRQKILVYDLGGGTFDVTLMSIQGAKFTTLATDGDVRLGGRDWDERLLKLAAEQFAAAHGFDPREDPNLAGALWRECKDAKRTLSARQKAVIACDFRGCSLAVDVTRNGRYSFELRWYPREKPTPIGATKASIRVGPVFQQTEILESAEKVVFELDLKSGHYDLETAFTLPPAAEHKGSWGAYFVHVSYLGN